MRRLIPLLLIAACGSAVAPSAVAPSLFAPGIGFDASRGALVVFSGQDDQGQFSGATWQWRSGQWTQITGPAPSGRMWSAMVYDSRRGRLVMLGGASAAGTMGDTWEYHGTWQQRMVTGPGPRFAHEMVYDSASGQVLMFGGTSPSGPRADLWSWNGTEWLLIAGSGPGSRFAHGMAFDHIRRELILFGGHGPTGGPGMQSLGDTWVFANGAWTQVVGPGPSARDHVSMAYDAQRRRVVLFGGVSSGPPPRSLSDTWEWDGASWTRAAETGPEARGNHRVVYDAVRRQVILLTGAATGTTTEIWGWDGHQWSRVFP